MVLKLFLWASILGIGAFSFSLVFAQTPPLPLKLGSVLPLVGAEKTFALSVKEGLEAAFLGKKIQGRLIQLQVENGANDPYQSFKATRKLVQADIFLMVGSVGEITAIASAATLKNRKIPAVGFVTGTQFLRPGTGGPIFNYRVGYSDETAIVVKKALSHGLAPAQICTFAQNDGHGMDGIRGVHLALKRNKAPKALLGVYEKIIHLKGHNPTRNNIGPIGVYHRNTNEAQQGYRSLKKWEKQNKTLCRLVVTIGRAESVAEFVQLSEKHKEPWILTAVSSTHADALKNALRKRKISKEVLMTQPIPFLDSKLPLVQEARQALGAPLHWGSLEGYIVGKMTLHLLKDLKTLTRENFIKQAKRAKFKIGGLTFDFTKGRNSGSDFVAFGIVNQSHYRELDPKFWKTLSPKRKK